MSSCCFPAEGKDHSGVTLIPNCSFVLKNLRSLFKPKVIQMYVSYSHPLVGGREVKMHLLCLDCSLVRERTDSDSWSRGVSAEVYLWCELSSIVVL